MELFYIPVAFACIHYLWHDTDAFVEYLKLLRVKKLFYVEKFQEEKENSGGLMNYPDYLLIHHGNFFIRLITCPICLSVWLNIAAIYLHMSVGIFFLTLWLTWLFYFGIKLIINKSDGQH